MPASATEQAPVQTASQNDIGCSDKRRFELELEFVQLLANPAYLTWLAQSDQLKDPALIKFLEYLQYWLRPEYAAYIM
jgi:mediator of RNA polymerase II transcription subunit 31